MQIKDAIKEYAMENKNNLMFKKNDKKRMVVNVGVSPRRQYFGYLYRIIY